MLGSSILSISSYLTAPLGSMKYVTLASVRPSKPFPTPYNLRNSPAESLRTGYYVKPGVSQGQVAVYRTNSQLASVFSRKRLALPLSLG